MPGEKDLLEEMLTELAGRKVRLQQPKQGDSFKTIRMAIANARMLLVEHLAKLETRNRVSQSVAALQEALGDDVRIGIEKAESRARLSCMYGQDDRIVVASVQTMRDKRLARFNPADFATVVIDECHHATAKTYRDIIGAFGSSKVLGMTATPDRGDGIGMDNAFDAVAYEYSMLDGMRDGYLCPLRALAVDVEGLDLSKVRTTAGELNEGDLRRILEVDEVLVKPFAIRALVGELGLDLLVLDDATQLGVDGFGQSLELLDVDGGRVAPGRRVVEVGRWDAVGRVGAEEWKVEEPVLIAGLASADEVDGEVGAMGDVELPTSCGVAIGHTQPVVVGLSAHAEKGSGGIGNGSVRQVVEVSDVDLVACALG
jgi:hypothetical protein